MRGLILLFISIVLPSTLYCQSDSEVHASSDSLISIYRLNYDGSVFTGSFTREGADSNLVLRSRFFDTAKFYDLSNAYFFVGKTTSGSYTLSKQTERFILLKHTLKSEISFNPLLINMGGGDSVKFCFPLSTDTVILHISTPDWRIIPYKFPLLMVGDSVVFSKANMEEEEGLLICKLRIVAVRKDAFSVFRYSAADYHRSFFRDYEYAVKSLGCSIVLLALWFWSSVNFRKESILPVRMAKPFKRWLPWMIGVMWITSVGNFMDPGLLHFDTAADDEHRVLTVEITVIVILILLVIADRTSLFKKYPRFKVFIDKICRIYAWTLLAYFLLVGVICLLNSLQKDVKDPAYLLTAMRLRAYNGPGLVLVACLHTFCAFVLFRLCLFSRWLPWLIVLAWFGSLPSEVQRLHGYTLYGKIASFLPWYSSQWIAIFYSALFLWAVIYYVRAWKERDSLRDMVTGGFLFALIYIIDLGGNLGYYAFVPLTAIVYLVLIPLLVLFPFRHRWHILRQSKRIQQAETDYPGLYTQLLVIRESDKATGSLKKKWLYGDLATEDYDKRKNELLSYPNLPVDRQLVRDRLRFGPYNHPVKNGLLSMTIASLLSVFASLFYLDTYIRFSRDGGDVVFQQVVLEPIAFFIAAGFLLGHQYPYIRGKFGWQKGFRMAIVVMLGLCPYFFLTTNSDFWQTILELLLRYVMIITITGFILDYSILKKIYGAKFRLQYLFTIQGLPNLVYLVTIAVTTVSTGLLNWVVEYIKSVFGKIGH